MKDFSVLLHDADALIIVPPFWASDMPCLGVHLLQACAKNAGFNVKILYVNLIMASEIGENPYIVACWESLGSLVGEPIFARSAFGVDAIQNFPRKYVPHYRGKHQLNYLQPYKIEAIVDKFLEFEARTDEWLDNVATTLLKRNFKVVGLTTSYQQTAASVALTNKIKSRKPEIITVLGGANCTDEMAEGIASLSNNIDFVFSGESEKTFPEFLKQVAATKYPENRIIKGDVCRDLNSLPIQDYSDYYEQLNFFMPDSQVLKGNKIRLLHETSRGCWWGEKQKCTFCGMNGANIQFRKKTPQKVTDELKMLLKKYPATEIVMTDSTFSYEYFESLLPQLSNELSDATIFFEIKPLTTLEQLVLLKKAGISNLQPGLETLSTSLLKKLNKGIETRHNIIFLRNAMSAGMRVFWNILWRFPQDEQAEYEEVLKRVQVIKHFRPPQIAPMIIARFSDYFNHPHKYGITNIRPAEIYNWVFPRSADIDKIACDFDGDFESFSINDDAIIPQLYKEIGNWNDLWRNNKQPKLELQSVTDNRFLLMDTRNASADGKNMHFLTRREAMAVSVNRKRDRDVWNDLTEWALFRNLIMDVDGWYLSLVTANPDLIIELTNEYSKSFS